MIYQQLPVGLELTECQRRQRLWKLLTFDLIAFGLIDLRLMIFFFNYFNQNPQKQAPVKKSFGVERSPN